MTAEKAGFSIALADNVQVTVGARQRVDLTMAVGQLTEKRRGQRAAPCLLQTDSSERSQVITGEQTRALPLNGREYSSLALLSPGVRLSALNTGGFTPREGSFNVNGLRSTFNNFLIDGVDNNAYGTSNQGFSNQVMQPSPDAVDEFKVVTNNMSAEYGRSAGATINVAYASGTNQFRGSAWEFARRTALNATGFFKPADGEKPPFERNQFGGVLGGPIVKNKAFFFADYEGFKQTRGQTATSTIADAGAAPGHPRGRRAQPAHRRTYPAGTPIPMTAFARKVLNDLPAPTNGRRREQLPAPAAFDEHAPTRPAARSTSQVSPRCRSSAASAGATSTSSTTRRSRCRRAAPATRTTYVDEQAVRVRRRPTRRRRRRCSKCASAGRRRRRQEPGGAGHRPARSTPTASPACPTDPRVAGGLPTQLITGFSDLGRQATNPQWQYPTVYNPKVNYTRLLGRHSLKTGYEFQHIQTEVQDVNPLYGRDKYAGQFTRPAGVTANNNLYNLADFMLGLRITYALSNILVADLAAEHALRLPAGRLARQRPADAEPRPALRVRDAVGREGQHPLELRSRDAQRWCSRRTARSQDRSTLKPDRNNFGPRLGFAYTLTPATVLRGGYGVSYVHFHRAGGANVLPINGPQVINAVVVQTPTHAGFRHDAAGLPGGPDRSVAVQSARRQHHLHARGLSLEPGAELVRLGAARAVARARSSTSPTSATAPTTCCCSPTSTRRRRTTRRHASRCRRGGRFRSSPTSPTRSTAASRATTRSRASSTGDRRAASRCLNSLTLSQTKDNGAGSLENPNGNFPAPQDFYNLDADFGLSALPPAVQQHDELRVRPAVRQRPALR